MTPSEDAGRTGWHITEEINAAQHAREDLYADAANYQVQYVQGLRDGVPNRELNLITVKRELAYLAAEAKERELESLHKELKDHHRMVYLPYDNSGWRRPNE